VYCAQFSPDGKLLATAGQDHTVRLWDPATGQERTVLRGHDRNVNWAEFSPDGGTLATAGDDGAVKLWDLNTGREVRQNLKASVPVIGVAFSPDGKLLAAGLYDGMVHWWDLPSGWERPSFRAHDGRIESIIFAPDGRTLATSAENAKLWDTATGKLKRLLPDSAGKANVIRFNHRGDVVAATSRFSQVQLWDPASGQRLLRLAHSNLGVQSASFSADDRLLSTANEDGTVRLWHTHTGKMLDLLMGHSGRIWCVAFSTDGRMLATAGRDGTVQLWDPDARRDRKVLASPPSECKLAFSPDGKRLIGGGQEESRGKLSIWEVPSGRLKACLPSREGVHCLAPSPDSRTLATGHTTGYVTMWDLDKGREWLTFSIPAMSTLAFTADGETLLANGTQNKVCQWEASTGKLLRAFSPTGGFAFAPRTGLVATASMLDGVVLWDLASGSSQPLPSSGAETPTGTVTAFSPDETILAGCRFDSVLLWDVVARRALTPLSGHQGPVQKVTFSPDGKTLASVSQSGEAKLWSVHTGQELLTLEDHRGPIHSIAFAPNGRMLATTLPGLGGPLVLSGPPMWATSL
jgi:WD40 repeat protein